MNDAEKNQQLLSDILKEGSFEPFNSNVRDQAVRVFERRHRIARARAIVIISALALVSTTFFFTSLQRHATKSEQATVLHKAVPQAKDRRFLISDEELLAYFPPDSCSLVTANGKTILVFWDDEVRKKLFREPSSKRGS